jgi:hypothetical protein
MMSSDGACQELSKNGLDKLFFLCCNSKRPKDLSFGSLDEMIGRMEAIPAHQSLKSRITSGLENPVYRYVLALEKTRKKEDVYV